MESNFILTSIKIKQNFQAMVTFFRNCNILINKITPLRLITSKTTKAITDLFVPHKTACENPTKSLLIACIFRKNAGTAAQL